MPVKTVNPSSRAISHALTFTSTWTYFPIETRIPSRNRFEADLHPRILSSAQCLTYNCVTPNTSSPPLTPASQWPTSSVQQAARGHPSYALLRMQHRKWHLLRCGDNMHLLPPQLSPRTLASDPSSQMSPASPS